MGLVNDVSNFASLRLTFAKLWIISRFRAIIANGFWALCLARLSFRMVLSLVAAVAMWKPP